MRILFLFQRFSFESSTIYLDLVRECISSGHEVFLLAGSSQVPQEGPLVVRDGCTVAYVKLPDQFHSGRIKKGLVQLLIEPIFLHTLKKYLWQEKIDIIAYPTPPITLAGVVKKAREHYGARTFLMLKDIFPQNAADLGMMSNTGALFRYFRRMEKRLYAASDVIGCMSEANIRYLAGHDPETESKLMLFPNTVRIKAPSGVKQPGDTLSFMLGGNLGEPQAVDVIMDGIAQLCREGFDGAKFHIVGDGTRAAYVKKRISEEDLTNVTYAAALPRDEYEELLRDQDVGIISLSHRFTIPNFPSRLLSYMQLSKPVLVVADGSTDMREVVEVRAQCGFYASSASPDAFVQKVKEICSRKNELPLMGKSGRRYLEENYDVKLSVALLERYAALNS